MRRKWHYAQRKPRVSKVAATAAGAPEPAAEARSGEGGGEPGRQRGESAVAGQGPSERPEAANYGTNFAANARPNGLGHASSKATFGFGVHVQPAVADVELGRLRGRSPAAPRRLRAHFPADRYSTSLAPAPEPSERPPVVFRP
ncbi:hypothetical protein L596_005381 [Steinernema carpocapsae]|uniref:Uncharacterized protein n=1 Tax=Steinernema carpocapsae TaxID=34508 RepID=A0A4U8UYX6_STECR|nr:hypothetical protein L596_005381 [Steinernema carpocapsae]